MSLADLQQEVALADLNKDQVIELQTQLSAQGFNPGGTDGLMGKNTTAAWEAFKLSKQLANPDTIGPDSVKALFAPPQPFPALEQITQEQSLTTLSSDQVKELQAGLAAHGFNPGGIDGILGKNTINAYSDFMHAKDLLTIGPDSIKTLETDLPTPPAPGVCPCGSRPRARR